ncbi:MAG: hypothetical protein NT129_06570 [Candidatus Aenigmarchaeota archaeon]|nr:hypothetical protein [Candidatus Aenigmarchaeota archaeon]
MAWIGTIPKAINHLADRINSLETSNKVETKAWLDALNSVSNYLVKYMNFYDDLEKHSANMEKKLEEHYLLTNEKDRIIVEGLKSFVAGLPEKEKLLSSTCVGIQNIGVKLAENASVLEQGISNMVSRTDALISCLETLPAKTSETLADIERKHASFLTEHNLTLNRLYNDNSKKMGDFVQAEQTKSEQQRKSWNDTYSDFLSNHHALSDKITGALPKIIEVSVEKTFRQKLSEIDQFKKAVEVFQRERAIDKLKADKEALRLRLEERGFDIKHLMDSNQALQAETDRKSKEIELRDAMIEKLKSDIAKQPPVIEDEKKEEVTQKPAEPVAIVTSTPQSSKRKLWS